MAANTETTSLVVLEAADLEVQPIYQSYRQADGQREVAGRQLGSVLLKWHGTYKAQGSRSGGGFDALLKRLDIPRATAYRCMHRVDPDYFVSCDTKCKQETSKHSKPRKISAGAMGRFFMELNSLVHLLDALDQEGRVFKFDDNSEQFLASAQRLRKQMTRLIAQIKRERYPRLQPACSDGPRQAEAEV